MLQNPQSSQGILPCLHSMSKSVFLLSERPQKLSQYPLPFCDWHSVLPFSGHGDIWIGWSPILGLGSLLPAWPLAASCLSLLFQSPAVLALQWTFPSHLPRFTTLQLRAPNPIKYPRKTTSHMTVHNLFPTHLHGGGYWQNLWEEKEPVIISFGGSIVHRITHKQEIMYWA